MIIRSTVRQEKLAFIQRVFDPPGQRLATSPVRKMTSVAATKPVELI
jgi:hypothetical protein